MTVETIPITDASGDIILYDFYINGNWIGSRGSLCRAEPHLIRWTIVKPAQRGVKSK